MSIQASNSINLYCAATPKTCPFNLSVSFTETSTSVERNTSSLVIEGYIKPNGTWFDTNYNNTLTLKWYDSKNGWKTVTSANIQDLMSNDAYYVSGTLGVEHNEDGTLSGYAQIEWTRHSNNASVIYVPPSGSVATSTTALTTIPRASSISSLSGTSLGSSVSVGISRASSSFTHKVEWKIGSSSYVTASSNATTSASFTPDVSYASQYPNGTSCTCTVRVTTYNGSTQIGSSVTSSCTLSIPSSVIPTCSDISLSRIDNGVPSSWGVYVQGYSQVTASISGSGIYGSSISSYYISGAGKSTNSSSLTSGVLTSSSTYSFNAYVTDSRGRTSSTKSASITVYAYSKPSISLTAQRCDSSGNVTSSGTYLKITCNYSYASVNGNNSISRSVSCNGASNTSFSSGTSFVLAANCSVTSMYTVTASISDALGNSATATVLIPTDERIMNVKSNGKGVAFGGFSINDNILDSAWPIHGVIADYYLSNLNYDLLRPTTANVQFGDGGIRFFKSTSNMTDGKPQSDGHIMHMAWDNSGGFDSQLFIPNNDDTMSYRFQRSGVWQSWKKLALKDEVLPLTGGTLTGLLNVKGIALENEYRNNSPLGRLMAYTTDGSLFHVASISPSNNTVFGWGGYDANIGSTNVYGNSINFISKNSISGNKAYTNSSDSRFKTNIENIHDDLINVWKELKPCIFEWNEKNSPDGKKHIGLIAQDVITAFEKYGLDYKKYAVVQSSKMFEEDGDDNEYFTLNYEYLDTLTMVVVKKQQEEVDSLKETVKTMASTIDSLKAEINSIKQSIA